MSFRVDYFRSIQIPKNALGLQQDFTMSSSQFPIDPNQYTNPTFQASSHDLTFPNRSFRQQQNVWSTSQSYLPSTDSQYNFKNTNLKGKNLDKPTRSKQTKQFTTKSRHNKRCVIITTVCVVIALAICAAIAFTLTYFYYWKPNSEKLATCFEECVDNRYATN